MSYNIAISNDIGEKLNAIREINKCSYSKAIELLAKGKDIPLFQRLNDSLTVIEPIIKDKTYCNSVEIDYIKFVLSDLIKSYIELKKQKERKLFIENVHKIVNEHKTPTINETENSKSYLIDSGQEKEIEKFFEDIKKSEPIL